MSITVIAILALLTSLADGPKAIFGIDADAVAIAAPAAYAAQTPDVPNPKFTPVAGATLDARLAAARARGRADASASHYWAAYAFDVRPGIAVDLEIRGAGGSVTTVEGVTIQNGSKIETRNLAVFLLYERNTDTPDRVEVYNLDRQRGYDGYPVYWLGRATNDESFALLEGLLQVQPSGWVAERAVVGIALHDDARVADRLEAIVRGSQVDRARKTAVMWIGIVSDHLAFLADVARNDREDMEVRKQAALAIGISKAEPAIATLRGLYDAVSSRDVREQVIVAAGIHGDENAADDEAVDFLIRIADNERDRELRRQAIFWLSQKAGRRSFDALVDRATGTKGGDTEVQKQAVFALSQRPKDEAVPILMKIAKTHANPEVRKMAIFWLGQIDDDRVLPFFKELLSH